MLSRGRPVRAGRRGGGRLPAAPDLFDDIHARVRSAEEKRQTIRARFTETTVSSLLVKPMVSEGTLVGAKPASLSMTYTSPERKSIVTDGQRMLITQPGRDERELDRHHRDHEACGPLLRERQP